MTCDKFWKINVEKGMAPKKKCNKYLNKLNCKVGMIFQLKKKFSSIFMVKVIVSSGFGQYNKYKTSS